MLKNSELRNAFLASAQLYLSLSLLFGTWVIYIPHITEQLSISEGELGVILLFGAIGSLVGTVSGKRLVGVFGEGVMAYTSILLQAVFIIGVFIAPNYYSLMVAFFCYGICGGLFQVGANAMVIIVERKYNTSIMSSCHGFFSLGALIASGLGTFLLILLDNALLHILISAGLVVVLQLYFIKTLRPLRGLVSEKKHSDKIQIRKNLILVWLAFIAMSVMITEGAIADWSGLYLKDVVNANEKWLGLAYAAFSLSMTIGRFIGDYFSRQFGAIQVVIAGFSIGVLGFLLLFCQTFLLVVAGFFIIGTGFSVIIPELYRVSANIKGVSSAYGIAFMASSGYVGFLIGPVFLGVLAESFGLLYSFITIFILISVGGLMAFLLSISSHYKAIDI